MDIREVFEKFGYLPFGYGAARLNAVKMIRLHYEVDMAKRAQPSKSCLRMECATWEQWADNLLRECERVTIKTL